MRATARAAARRSPRSRPPPAVGESAPADRPASQPESASPSSSPGGELAEPRRTRGASRRGRRRRIGAEYRQRGEAATRSELPICRARSNQMFGQMWHSGAHLPSLRAMSERLQDKRWPWLVAAGAIALAFLSTVVEIRLPGDADPRPLGSALDIEKLRDRDDVNVPVPADRHTSRRSTRQLRLRRATPAHGSTSSPAAGCGSPDTSRSRRGPSHRWPRCGLASTRGQRDHALRSRDPRARRACRPRSFEMPASRPSGCGATAGSPRPSASTRASRCTSAPRQRRAAGRARKNPTLTDPGNRRERGRGRDRVPASAGQRAAGSSTCT